MILEVTGDQIAQLTDTDLRTLVGYLCEREVRGHGHSPSAVTWGGHQNAGDGGVDVRVALSAGAAITGYVPKAATAFQVKAQKMPRGAILEEMAPGAGLDLTLIKTSRSPVRVGVEFGVWNGTYQGFAQPAGPTGQREGGVSLARGWSNGSW